MKKIKKVYEDKVYRLKRDAAPLSYMLSTKHTKRKALLYFDEETGVNRALRYARNQKSIFEDEQEKVGAKYLVQGTIAPDWIESGGGVRDTIKSHHNVGGLPEDMTLEVVEPLRDLYKDEVRDLARALEINVAERQPFPGPGLAVRTLGDLTPERVAVVREACAIVEEEFEAAAEAGLMEIPWQYFAALLPVRSVGVHGDVRAYGETIVVRAVQSMDGMSARYSEIPHAILQKISTRITNTVKGAVNRVVYDITHKPPGTIEWE